MCQNTNTNPANFFFYAILVDVIFVFVFMCEVVVNHCFTSLFGTKGLLSDIIIR